MEIKVGILAIGNEVVDGQIVNRNAAWLGEQLQELGATNLYHLSCRDDPADIEQSLNFMSAQCHLILISGGLGPTNDDRTRGSLSQWCGYPLEFREDLWQEVKDKLEARSVTLREGHKNQAYIPQGAEVLKNSNGVAPGFFVKAPHCFLASLPGPPFELQRMFREELTPLIQKNLSPKSLRQLTKWICLGAPESEVAHIAESCLGPGFDVGYRLHKPYVEVKVWLPLELDSTQKKALNLMNDKLSPWLVAYDLKNVRRQFQSQLETYDRVYLIDQITRGRFLEKINGESPLENLRYQCVEKNRDQFVSESEGRKIMAAMNPQPKELYMGLFPANEKSAWVFMNDQVLSVDLPMRFSLKSQLGQLFVIEKAYLHFFKREDRRF